MEASLSGVHDGFVKTQISRAVSGTNIPDEDRARQLLSQGRNFLSGQEPDGKEDAELERLWMELESQEEGTIVLIDTGDNQ